MTKYNYDLRNISLAIHLFEEEGIIIYDCISICNNLDIKSLYIYSRIRFDRKYITSFPICYDFTNTKCEESVRYRMKKLMQKNPHMSLDELTKITGHSKCTTVRHYMTLKREIINGKEV